MRTKRGRCSARTLESLCDEYFRRCDKEGKRYTLPGLALAVGVAPDTLLEWAREGGGAYDPRTAQVVHMALARMSDALQQRSDSMAIFSLKQPCYGGYTEGRGKEKKGALSVNVSFGGEDGQASAGYGG